MEKLPFSLNMFLVHPGNQRFHSFYAAKILRSENCLAAMRILNDSLQKLELSYCTFNSEDLKNLLMPFEQLNHLSMRKVKIKDEGLEFLKGERILKKFEMIQTDHKILKILKNYQIINFEIIDAVNDYDKEILLNFLKSQKLLEVLSVEELIPKNPSVLFLGENHDYNFEFQLKKFSATFSSNFSENFIFENNLLNFLNHQSKFLKELKIDGMLPQSIYKQIISKSCNNLKVLEITPNKIPQEKSFFENLKFNSLNTLKINSTIDVTNFYGLREFLRLCKNLKKLILTDTDNNVANELFNWIAFNLVNLETLFVLNFSLNYDPQNSFKSLKIFSIRIMQNIDQWLKFILLNQNLEKTIVGWMQRDFDVRVIKQILIDTKIKHMIFGGRFIANKKIYDAVKNDYKNLRILELKVSNYDEIKHLKFIFPKDKNLFNSKCLYFEENNDREPLND